MNTRLKGKKMEHIYLGKAVLGGIMQHKAVIKASAKGPNTCVNMKAAFLIHLQTF